MSKQLEFNLKRTCDCRLVRQGVLRDCAGVIIHCAPCKQKGMEWLTKSGDPIIPGKRYRWINGDDQWSRDRGYEEINVVAEVTQVNEAGMVFAYWHHDRPRDEQHGLETCIPNTAVVERVGDE